MKVLEPPQVQVWKVTRKQTPRRERVGCREYPSGEDRRMKGTVGGSQDSGTSGHPRSPPGRWRQDSHPGGVDGERVAGGLASTALSAHEGRAEARMGRWVCFPSGAPYLRLPSGPQELHGGPSHTAGLWRPEVHGVLTQWLHAL